MYLGDYQLGDRLPLEVFCQTAAGLPVEPDDAPVATVYAGSSTTSVVSLALPPSDRFGAAGLFQQTVHLDGRFNTGRYNVLFSWLASGSPRVSLARFLVLPGGDARGAVIALAFYQQPQAQFLVHQTDAGRLLRGRNPRL